MLHIKQNPSTNSLPKKKLLKHILAALSGATLALGATFSLFSSGVQAASFVTEFQTDGSNVTLDWSGEDADDDGHIRIDELIDAEITWDGVTYDLYDSDLTFVDAKFDYDTEENLLKVVYIDKFKIVDDKVYFINFSYDIFTYFSYLALQAGPEFYALKGQIVQETEMTGGGTLATTPEPTLTLGLITLGGLMLGSRKKEKA